MITSSNVYFHKSDLYNFEEDYYLIVKDKTHEIDSISLNRFALQIGSYILKIFKFDKEHLFQIPEPHMIETSMKKIGFDYDEKKILEIKASLKPDNLRICFNRHLKDLELQSSLGLNLKNPKITIIALTKSPLILTSIAPFDPLKDIKTLLSRPDKAYSDYQSLYSYGTQLLITQEKINTMASDFFAEFIEFAKALTSPQPLACIELKSGTQVVLKKNDDLRCSLYWIFNDQCWKGAYKAVMMAACVERSLSPAGISVSSDEAESIKEITLRKTPSLSRLFTPLYSYFSSKEQYTFIHGWASNGTFFDVCQKHLPLIEKDDLALQLIENMEVLHSAGVHKDLNSSNILVDRSHGKLSVFINDLGSFTPLDQTEEMRFVRTNSVNLSPELLKKAAAHKGLFWSDIFSVPGLTGEDWLLSERFHIGMILLELYLEHNPLFIHFDHASFLAMFPLSPLSFHDIMSDPLKRYRLAEYLDDRSVRMEYQFLFRDAYKVLSESQSQETSLDPIAPNETGSSGSASYEPLKDFETLFQDPKLRMQLEPYLGVNLPKLERIYRFAYKKMSALKSHVSTAWKASMLLDITQIKLDAIGSTEPRIHKRIELIKTLLDTDPTKRPPFNTLRHQLQTTIFLNP